jgi:tRNA-splicing ligase RtcB
LKIGADPAGMGQVALQCGLAAISDVIEPYGSIMAGDWEQDAPWRKKKK